MDEWLEAEQRIELAQQLCESARWAEALEQIDCALQINPHNGSWWRSKGCLLDQLERYDEAINAYEAALELEPGDQELLTVVGLDCIRTGQMLRAITLFQKVQAIDPDYEPAYCHRIMLYAEIGEHELAEEMFYLAQQITDQCPHCYWHVGCSLWARREIKRALYCWQRVLEIEPNYRGARRRIAEAHRRLGDLGTARDYYLAEYREDPSNYDLLVDLGQMLLESGQLAEAAAKFQQVLEISPSCARALELLGDAHNQSGEDERALRVYRAAVEIDPHRGGVHYKLGARLMSLGRFQEAKLSLDAELQLRPTDKATLMAAGNCALELGQPDDAQTCFENLLAVDESLPGAYHNLGVCHFLREEYDEGIRQCQTALALKDDYALARHKLVLAYMHLDRWGEARRLLDDSLARQPADPVLQSLRRRWTSRRMAAWAGRLGRTVKRLVTQAEGG